MNARDQQALGRAAAVLFVAGVLRFSLAPPSGPAVLPAHGDAADSLLLASDSAAEANEERRRPLEVGETLDPNRASALELDRLPGIGAAKAAAIVSDREARGPYETIQDLTRVPGLGPRTVERLQPFLSLPEAAKGRLPQRRRLGVMEKGGIRSRASIDVNRAGADQLTTLPGIGEVLARRVVAHRTSVGRFRSVEDLLQVPGIGPSKLDQLKRFIVVRP